MMNFMYVVCVLCLSFLDTVKLRQILSPVPRHGYLSNHILQFSLKLELNLSGSSAYVKKVASLLCGLRTVQVRTACHISVNGVAVQSYQKNLAIG